MTYASSAEVQSASLQTWNLRISCQHLHDKLTAWLSLAHAEASRRGGLAWALKVVGSLPLNTGCERKFIESQHHSNYKDLAPEFWLTE